MTSFRRARTWTIAALAAALLLVAGCSGSSGTETDGPTTSFAYLIDPLEPGTGFIQLGQNRYPFDGVICATGPVESDPEGSTRIFGVYANFEVEGTLAAVALTRYHNEVHGKTDSVPTYTETALIQMQGDKEIRGLSAKRFQIVGANKWQDPNDPNATTKLITREGDRYEARGTFAPVNADFEETTTTVAGGTGTGSGTGTGTGSSTTTGAADAAIVGEVAARCPAKTDSTTTTMAGGSTTTKGATTVPAVTTGASRP